MAVSGVTLNNGKEAWPGMHSIYQIKRDEKQHEEDRIRDTEKNKAEQARLRKIEELKIKTEQCYIATANRQQIEEMESSVQRNMQGPALKKAISYRITSMPNPDEALGTIYKVKTTFNKRVARMKSRRTKTPDSERSHHGSERERSSSSVTDLVGDDLERDYDFDADDDLRPQSEYAKYTNPCQIIYHGTCKALNIIPAKFFIRHLGLGTQEISMKHHSLGPNGAKACATALVNNTTVNKLDLGCDDLGPEGAFYIGEMLRDNVYITDLNLADNQLATPGLKTIAEVMSKNTSVKKLNLSGNDFVEEDGELVAEMMEENNSIKELVLSHNEFRELGGQTIAPALAQNGAIELLDLSWNHLRNKGAVAIGDSLKSNTCLKTLNVAWNGFYLKGCRALAKSLPENNQLIELNLICNRINQECLIELLRGLKNNETLKVLKIAQNPLSTLGVTAMLQIMQQMPNIGLSEIDISDQCVTKEFIDLLAEVRKDRTLTVKYGREYRKEEIPKVSVDDFISSDPVMVLMEFCRLRGLRLVDMFTSLDKDHSWTLTRKELKDGLLAANIPLTSRAMDKLITKLDVDGDGEVDFGELIAGQKEHIKKMHRLRKLYANKEPEDNIIMQMSEKLQALMRGDGKALKELTPVEKLMSSINKDKSPFKSPGRPTSAMSRDSLTPSPSPSRISSATSRAKSISRASSAKSTR
ncbi:unnamed protein product [Owenia fusiformis]|uniref:Uncharacterized protein n=1 Tax=Owenia fusiformis TaxID=6347 RepID=A0A8J1XMN5_OWEFU|nr:unnamed protein product [Owenia fusiformis]